MTHKLITLVLDKSVASLLLVRLFWNRCGRSPELPLVTQQWY